MALNIATGALEACKARGYATSVVVLDRGGRAEQARPARRSTTVTLRQKARRLPGLSLVGSLLQPSGGFRFLIDHAFGDFR
jgi:hypothetical protein